MSQANASPETAAPCLHYDNSFVRELPGDPETNNACRQVVGACYSRVVPTRVAAPQLVSFAPAAAGLLGIEPQAWRSQEWIAALAGNDLLAGMDPHAACYGGHQFGNWAGQLGDGRAISLGEVLNEKGERWELQLKGAGPTPFSRRADGRAVMRSSVREFLCSEAMHALGVPTTRALSLVSTGDAVVRDMFYDGNAKPEAGAIVCRMAPSFLRFGSLELPASRGDQETLRALTSYLLRQHYPHLGELREESILALFSEVCERTATVVAHWMRVGFVHGVMNTDNLSLLGLTIDYGPYGWLENFDPDWTPNTTDAGGKRYRFRYQPRIALWNLLRLAEALASLLETPEAMQAGLDKYCRCFRLQITAMYHKKLGLVPIEEQKSEEQERRLDDTLRAGNTAIGVQTGEPLIDDLLGVLTSAEIDMTIFFRQLAKVTPGCIEADIGARALLLLSEAFYEPEELQGAVRQELLDWLQRYAARLETQTLSLSERQALMNSVNPKYVLRNYLAQQAIDAWSSGDGSQIDALARVLQAPYEEHPGDESLARKRPEWARHRAGCSMLSCSS